MATAFGAMTELVRDIASAVVEEAVPRILEKMLPEIVRQAERIIADDRSTVGAAGYVPVKAAAAMMSAHPSTVRKLVADGKLGRYSVEGQIRIKVSDIHAYLARGAGPGSPTVDLQERALEILRGKARSNDP
jgi:excisionase family DNA binding protein